MMTALLLVATVVSGPSQAPEEPPQPAPAAFQGVAVLEDGSPMPFTSPGELGRIEPAPAHAWIWSRDLPPLRIDDPTAASLDPNRLRADIGWSRLQIAATGAIPAGQLISAPREMWEEVPERLLPRHDVPRGATEVRVPVRQGTDWRVRYLAGRRASIWIDWRSHEAPPLLVPEPAVDWRAQILTGPDEHSGTARISILRSDARGVELSKLADARTDGSGRLELLSLPRESELLVLVTAPDTLPLLVRGSVDELPSVLRLTPGATVAGFVRTPDGIPVPGASVEGRAWLDGSPIPLRRSALSDSEGRWQLENLPMGRLTLVFSAEGTAPLSFPVDVATSPHSVGEIVLTPTHLLHLVITDAAGVPLTQGEVRIRGRQSSTADSEGKVVLELHPDEPLDAIVDAPGHIPTTVRRFPPLPRELHLRLEAAVMVVGRFLDSAALPVPGGRVEIESNTALSTHEMEPDGSFELEVTPGEEARLRLTSPSTTALELSVGPAAAGQRIDLGDLTAPAGVTVSGWLVDAESGAPIPGARVWAPRLGSRGLNMAWALGDLVEATSDAQGAFRMTGLAVQPVTIRVEARGLAPARLTLSPTAADQEIDVGRIFLGTGTDLVVSVEEADAAPSSAVLDLGGMDLEVDRQTAPFRDGEALFRHVPPGTFELAVLSAGLVTCRTTVEVEERLDRQEITCENEGSQVTGTVEVGGRPAGAGVLRWVPDLGDAPQPDVILNTGWEFLRRQRVFASSDGEAMVDVDSSGEFESRALRPGDWLVLFQPEGGSAIGPQRVTLARSPAQTIVLRYPGLALRGTVVDGDARPVAEAQVRTADGSAFARTELDGSFVLGALAPGSHRIQARAADRKSRFHDVVLEEHRDPDPVVLVVERQENATAAEVLGEDETPLAGALVFFDLGVQGMRLVTSDASGQARIELPGSDARVTRIAAFHGGRWMLGSPLAGHDGDRGPLRLTLVETGSLVLTTDRKGVVSPRIVSSNGWDLSILHSWLGQWLRLSEGAPLQLDGLPEGSYQIQIDDRQTLATVTAGEQSEVRIAR